MASNDASGGVKIGKPFNPYKVFVGSFIPNVLLRYDGLSPLEKLVWARLAQYAGERGYCYPSYDALAAELGISRRQAIRAVGQLVEARFIEVVEQNKGGAGRVNIYRFLFHSCLIPYETEKTVTRCHRSNSDNLSPLTVTKLVKNGDKSGSHYKGVKENQEDNQWGERARPHPRAVALEKATAALEELHERLACFRDNGTALAIQDSITVAVLQYDLGGKDAVLKLARGELEARFPEHYVRRELAAWRAGRDGEKQGRNRGP